MKKINYNDLNSKQKENYNYHKVASALADYGYDSMRLNNDWQGADFIAVKDDEMLKIQLIAVKYFFGEKIKIIGTVLMDKIF